MRIEHKFYGFIMKRLILLALFITTFFMSYDSLYCQDTTKHPIDVKMDECFEEGSYSIRNMCDCIFKYEASWKALVDKGAKEIEKKLDNKSRSEFRKAQKLWYEYVENDSRFYSHLTSPSEGAEQVIINAMRFYDLVKKRAMEIEEYLDRIEYINNN